MWKILNNADSDNEILIYGEIADPTGIFYAKKTSEAFSGELKPLGGTRVRRGCE